MIFTPIGIEGSYLISPDLHRDDRGLFARVWCEQEFRSHQLSPHMRQGNVSRTELSGTLRGLHYQVPPYQESKLVRCTHGGIYDVALDLRPESPTYRQWRGLELSPGSLEMIYIPEGCAHGYQSLKDNTEVTYLTSEFYVPEAELGVRYDDPAFTIKWPLRVTRISNKDLAWPGFTEANRQ